MNPLKTALAFVSISAFSLSCFGQTISKEEEYSSRAFEFKRNSEPDSALVYFEKAESEAGKSKGYKSYESQSLYLNEIGIILTRKDEYEKAKVVLEKAVELALINPDTNTNILAHCYQSLGVVYSAEENYAKSLNYHFRALTIRQYLKGENDAFVASAYGNIGNVYLKNKEIEKAIEAHSKALKIRGSLFGLESPAIAESYTGLGNAYKEKKEYKTAREYFEKALQNKIKEKGPLHKDLIKYYKNLSEAYYLEGNTAQGDINKSKAEEIKLLK